MKSDCALAAREAFAMQPRRWINIAKIGVSIHETHFSTQPAPALPEPRISETNVDQAGSADYQSAARQGQEAAGRIIEADRNLKRSGRPGEW